MPAHATADDMSWFWSGVDSEVVSTLSEEQKQAILSAVRRQEALDMPADVRLSFGRYFLVMICGKERRNSSRLREERRQRPVFTRRNLALIIAVWGSLVYTGVSALGLVVKYVFQVV